MYKIFLAATLFLFATACQTIPAEHKSVSTSAQNRSMKLAGMTLPPRGFAELCAQEPTFCEKPAVQGKPVDLTNERWRELVEVNAEVNSSFAFATDSDVFGKSDKWSYLKGAGDCEDFALEKRQRLLARGWPPSALLIAVAKVPNVGTHAVLVAVTKNGDYVLDILEKSVRPWTEVNYAWLMRQSQADPKAWRRVSA